MRYIDYLFYQVYNLFNKEYLFYGLSKMEYRAAGFISVVLYINFITILNWVNYNLFTSDLKLLPIGIAVFFVSMGMVYFTRQTKLDSIVKSYQHNNSSERDRGLFMLGSYVVISLVMLIFSF
ncbi:MAG: hypothetical protein NXI25_23675 [bacterium]|nr:hypothetical protein [bacterium]